MGTGTRSILRAGVGEWAVRLGVVVVMQEGAQCQLVDLGESRGDLRGPEETLEQLGQTQKEVERPWRTWGHPGGLGMPWTVCSETHGGSGVRDPRGCWGDQGWPGLPSLTPQRSSRVETTWTPTTCLAVACALAAASRATRCLRTAPAESAEPWRSCLWKVRSPTAAPSSGSGSSRAGLV